MEDNNKYILDANIFIEAARRYYSFDFGTRFWDFLIEKAQNGILFSIDNVLKELKKGDKNDPLRQWAENSFVKYFLATNNDDVIKHYIEVINFVNNNNHNQYTQNAIDDFLKEDNADAWILAYAKYQNFIVVTHEAFNPNCKKRVLISNICEDFNIKYINTFEMLKKLNFKL